MALFSKNELGIVYWQEFLSSSEQAFFTKEWCCHPPSFSSTIKDQPRRLLKRGTSKVLVSCIASSIISELYQLYDMAVDVTFHNSIPHCKRIRIIIAVIVYTPFVLTYVIKQ